MMIINAVYLDRYISLPSHAHNTKTLNKKRQPKKVTKKPKQCAWAEVIWIEVI